MPLTLRQGHPGSLGFTILEFDDALQTLPQPLSPPMPFTASIPDNGLDIAQLGESVTGVNSIPLHAWAQPKRLPRHTYARTVRSMGGENETARRGRRGRPMPGLAQRVVS